MGWLNLMIVPCWELDPIQKRELDNPHCDSEELFSSTPSQTKISIASIFFPKHHDK